MTLLNYGPKYAIHSNPNIHQTIVDIEAGINNTPYNLRLTNPEIQDIRTQTAKAISNVTTITNKQQTILNELNQKPCTYLQSDKGGRMTILDEQDYIDRMTKKITDGPYRKLRKDPLPDLIKKTNKILNECKHLLGDDIKKLRQTNPILPRLKGQPKIHKPGKEMREIFTAQNCPTQLIGKWLIEQFQKMPNQPKTFSIKNTNELLENLKTSEPLQEDEILVSFDIKALYPSIPVKEALNKAQDWLLQQPHPKAHVNMYMKLLKLCMEECYFVFQGEFYKQLGGAPAGLSPSGWIAEIFLSPIETQLNEKGLLPRSYNRYVDDSIGIIKKQNLEETIKIFNSQHKNLQYTYEIEKDGKLPFLDVIISRDDFKTVQIYRKPTDTMRIIPSTSNHTRQHKMAAFNHLIHRMLTLPLNQEGMENEWNHIMDIADINGYDKEEIEKMIHKKQKKLQPQSTLTPQKQPKLRVAVEHNNITKKLTNRLRNSKIQLVFSSRNNQLKNRLRKVSDKVDKLEQNGIYSITCKDCNKKYVGQTKRSLGVRFEEHTKEVHRVQKARALGKNREFKSKVAQHLAEEGHKITVEDIQLVKNVRDARKLDVEESIAIVKSNTNQLLNSDQGNGYSWLFKYLKNNKN
jgi:hypothetical protein